MTRRTSPAGRAALKAEEGSVRRTYLDTKGIPTKGIGHTNAAGPPVVALGDAPWTDEQIDQVFENDLARNYEPAVDRALTDRAPQHAFDGSVSFHFNTGAIERATWVRLYNQGKPWKDAFLAWNKPSEIVPRRVRECNLIDQGIYRGSANVLASDNWTSRRDEVRQLQTDLGLLGFYSGEVDGIWGPETENAVRKFQSTHPDLAVDGRVGPATRAQLQRAKALLKGGGGAAGGVAGSGVGAFAGAPAWFVVALLLVSLAGLGYIAWRYRREVIQRINKWRGIHVS